MRRNHWLNIKGKTSFKIQKSYEVFECGCFLGPRITRTTGHQGVAWITAKNPVCQTLCLHCITSSESKRKYRRKTLRNPSAPCKGWHSKPLEEGRVVISCSTGNLMASLGFFSLFSRAAPERPLGITPCLGPCTPLAQRARSPPLLQVSTPVLSWDPDRQLQLCQASIWSRRQSVPTRQTPGYAGCHSQPTMLACFPSNPQLVWGQFNIPNSPDWKRTRNRGQPWADRWSDTVQVFWSKEHNANTTFEADVPCRPRGSATSAVCE